MCPIPVANRMIDYEEYYEIDPPMFEAFLADTGKALRFVERCRTGARKTRACSTSRVAIAARRCE